MTIFPLNVYDTIVEHRRRLLRTLKRNPSLKPYFEAVFADCYQDARQDATTETQLSMDTFPEECPFTKQDVIDPDFLP
ncbi:MAG: DUF29 domain-containing protein [Crocosphaera sp.]